MPRAIKIISGSSSRCGSLAPARGQGQGQEGECEGEKRRED